MEKKRKQNGRVGSRQGIALMEEIGRLGTRQSIALLANKCVDKNPTA